MFDIRLFRFFDAHAATRSEKKDWLDRNQNNVSEFSDMLFQLASTINIENKACWSGKKRILSSSH